MPRAEATSPFAERHDSGDPSDSLPPLETGERMDQKTFHARYLAMPEDVHAELIGGTVYLMASPVGGRHTAPYSFVQRWLGEFEEAAPGTEARSDGTVILSADNEIQPDCYFRILPDWGGQSRDRDDYVEGAPELVVEVASSSAAYDLQQKKAEYEQAGVGEYVVVLPREQQVSWFWLEAGRYQTLEPGEDGIFRSRQFPGLWLDPQALLERNPRRVKEVVRQGIASPEHREWLDRAAVRGR